MKKITVTLICCLAALAVSFNTRAATTSGVITGSETWSGTIFLSGDVTVAAGGSLTILPGTIVQADAGTDNQVSGEDLSHIELVVEAGGALSAVGTEQNPILFTSSPVPPAVQALADWYGVRVKSDSVQIKYCTFEWAEIGLSVEDFRQTIEHCVFQSNRGAGVSVNCEFVISNSIVRGNGLGIASTTAEHFIRVLDSVIASNGQGVYTPGELQAQGSSFTGNGEAIITENGLISNCIISGNSTGVRGPASISNSIIKENTRVGVESSAQLAIDNCVISLNGEPATGPSGIVFFGGSCVVLNTSITDNVGAGIYFVYDGHCFLSNNVIRGSAVGFLTGGGGQPSVVATLTNNLIFSNADFEIYSGSKGPIGADGNYFGEPTTSELQNGVRNLSRIHDTRDDVNVGQVIISKWLGTPEGIAIKPVLVKGPASHTTYQGNKVTLSVLANGSGPLTYQWFKETTPISTATSSSLTFNSVLTTDTGFYSVRVSNAAGTFTTDPVFLNVKATSEAPVLSLQFFAGVQIQGVVGRTYRIQYVANPDDAGDWTSWTTLTTLVLPSTPFVFIDPTSGGSEKRFYRAVLLP